MNLAIHSGDLLSHIVYDNYDSIMRIFKYKTFEKWARKQGISNAGLKKTINEIQNGLIDAKLGGGVYKKI